MIVTNDAHSAATAMIPITTPPIAEKRASQYEVRNRLTYYSQKHTVKEMEVLISVLYKISFLMELETAPSLEDDAFGDNKRIYKWTTIRASSYNTYLETLFASLDEAMKKHRQESSKYTSLQDL